MSETEVQPAPATETGGDDVRAAVVAAFEHHNQPEPEAAEPAPATETVEADASATRDRARNERGQFIRADGSVDTEAEAAQPNTDADPAEAKLEQPSTAAEPPTSWSADAKSEWSKLSPALQQAVLKREAEINEGGRRWSEEKRAYDDMLAPVRAQAQRAGVDEREGLNRLIAASDFLDRDPANAIRWLAQNYGVDLSKPEDNAVPATAPDPLVRRLHEQVTTLEQSIRQREFSEAQSELSRFASEDGHEHFEAVKKTMGKLIETGQAASLQEAYDAAIWSNPEIRPKLIAAQTAKAEADRKAQERETAAKARRAAVSITGSPSGAGAPIARPEYDTVQDAVRAAYQRHAG